jgi:hypothetical protein
LTDSDPARREHENIGQPCTQPGSHQHVTDRNNPDVQTVPVVCQNCGATLPTTKITQEVHKNNTSVEGQGAALLADIPSELRQVVIHWHKMPQYIKDGIKATLQGFLLASGNTGDDPSLDS